MLSSCPKEHAREVKLFMRCQRVSTTLRHFRMEFSEYLRDVAC
jgi:hypothetical protein